MASTTYIYNPVQNLTSQQQKLAFFENSIIRGYIAPYRNKHIFGVTFHGKEEDSFSYNEEYVYGADDIEIIDQIVTIEDDGTIKCVIKKR